jgi:proline iminopeptidase
VSREIPVEGGALHVTVAGEGPPALLLHGGPGLSDFLEPLALLLAHDATTARYTQRGVPPAPTAGPFTVAQHVTDAVAILDALELERAFVIGNSWGGFLALALAAAHPERVRGLVSIDGLGVTGDGGWVEYDAAIAGAMTPEAGARAAEIDDRVRRGEEISDADLAESVRLCWPFMHADPDTATVPELRTSGPAYNETAADVRAILEAGTLARQLASCTVPALFLPGERSPMPAWAAQQAAALLPNGQVVTIPGSGHFPFVENAPATREAIVTFLGSLA